ncbi:hypothetical protein [Streptomyces sp. CC224B]|uniref:hypothetical protein n=1 Tax=Streptomyces sp. CC224B TaxID=3044571 RepID=UPI0024A9DD54|nr:hypothetical protein [Streptomyces sp. CC224B]
MTEHTPSQAEGERPEDSATDEEPQTPEGGDAPRTTPSQAEGEDTPEATEDDGAA